MSIGKAMLTVLRIQTSGSLCKLGKISSVTCTLLVWEAETWHPAEVDTVLAFLKMGNELAPCVRDSTPNTNQPFTGRSNAGGLSQGRSKGASSSQLE